MLKRLIGIGALALGALLLAGCANTRIIDSSVQSYSTLAAAPQPPSYRLERLPSQQQSARQRGLLEAAATTALANVGLQRDDANGAFRLELSSYASRYLPDWPHYGGFSWGLGYGPWGWHPAFGYYGGWRERPPTLYVFEVRLILRDAAGAVVYETHARYDDIWSNEEEIYRALFKAALDGFPTPPQGPRTIRHEITP